MDCHHKDRCAVGSRPGPHPASGPWKAIHTWHVCIGGFTQHTGRPTGLETLWSMLRNSHANGRVCVELRAWHDRWDRLAEQIFRFRPISTVEELSVCCYAYSWGAGWGFVQLARELRKRAIQIRAAVLTDAVYRHPLWLGMPLALSPFRRVTVPTNVREVFWFHQRLGRPYGHQVVAEDPDLTTIHPGVQVQASHAYMDDFTQFYDRALQVAGRAHTEGAHDAQAPRGHRPEGGPAA